MIVIRKDTSVEEDYFANYTRSDELYETGRLSEQDAVLMKGYLLYCE